MMTTNTKQLVHRTGLGLILMVLVLSLTGAAPAQKTGASSYIVEANSAAAATAMVEAVGGTVTSQLDIIDGVGALLDDRSADTLRQQNGIKAVVANSSVTLQSDPQDGGPTGNNSGKGSGNNNNSTNNGNNNSNNNDPDRNDPFLNALNRGNGLNEVGGTGRAIPATDYPDVTGANLVWQDKDTGAGSSVAVLDTGLSLHRGLIRSINGRLDHISGWVDFVDHFPLPIDPNGHGSHVAGIIANTQVGSDNEYDGMAPGVNLVGVRVLNEKGVGTYENVIKGVQWVLDHQQKYNIKVMNLSLISAVQSPYWADPLNQALMKAWAHGITVVVAAGNGGPNAMSIGVPGNNPYVITVGAFTDNYTPNNWNDDTIAPFSAAGPTLDGFVKPDVVAPGAHMVSTMLPNSQLARDHEANKVTNSYFSMAGTSQAAAAVSGVAALVISKHPELSPDQVKYRIMVSAFPWVDSQSNSAPYSVWQQGSGRVNAADAVKSDIQGSANTGMDIQADLSGQQHYEGYSYYDEDAKEFRLRGDNGSMASGFGVWSGGFGVWSGGFGVWSGGFGVWSGGFGVWSGNFTWDPNFAQDSGFGVWSGGFGVWSGGYSAWSGGPTAWTGSEPWIGSNFADQGFIQNYLAGQVSNASTKSTSINTWVDEP